LHAEQASAAAPCAQTALASSAAVPSPYSHSLAAIASAGLAGASSGRRARLRSYGRPQPPIGGLAKRAVDLVLASAILVLAAPIMLAVASLIRVLMGGPVLFGHKRVGYQGRSFVCYKFRTMAHDAQALLDRHLSANPEAASEWAATRKLADDPRVTALGRLLRKSSLDELPQLFNVLRGEMSLVGPRPVVPEELPHYGRHAQAYYSVRPGLTGLWQTTGRNSVSYRGRVARDRYYAGHWSLWLDLVLLLRTLPAVLKFDQTA
jgi:exopolysaccharide production protein ExoY